MFSLDSQPNCQNQWSENPNVETKERNLDILTIVAMNIIRPIFSYTNRYNFYLVSISR